MVNFAGFANQANLTVGQVGSDGVSTRTRSCDRDWQDSGSCSHETGPWGKCGWLEASAQLVTSAAASAQGQICLEVAFVVLPQQPHNRQSKQVTGVPSKTRCRWVIYFDFHTLEIDLVGRI